MPFSTDIDEQDPAAMFQSLDSMAKTRKETEELSRTRSNSPSSDTSRRPSIPERIIVTENGVVTAIETIGVFEEDRRGRMGRYYLRRGGERPIID
jgi:hypothetical protein